MIASFIEGRVRLRADALKDPEKLQMVENAVKSYDGVLSTRANPRTGSLLVEYDPRVIPTETLQVAAEALGKELNEQPAELKSGRASLRLMDPKTEMLLLTGSMGFTLLGGVLSKQVHVAAGVLFALLCGKHMYNRRRFIPVPHWTGSGVELRYAGSKPKQDACPTS